MHSSSNTELNYLPAGLLTPHFISLQYDYVYLEKWLQYTLDDVY